ncbi:unnamed protein product, partial [Symbiodinium microadriaticum]
MASQRQLRVLRQGFAEHGEDWLRKELDKHSVRELRGVAAAAGVPRNEGGAQRSKKDLLAALCRCIAEEEDDEGAASGQRLFQVSRDGFARHGEDWLRQELDKHGVLELRRDTLAVAAHTKAYQDEPFPQQLWEEGEYTDQHIIEEHGAAIWYKFLFKRHHRREAQRRLARKHEEWLNSSFDYDFRDYAFQ